MSPVYTVEEKAGLDLNILLVAKLRIGEKVLPDLTFPGQRPDPDFLSWLVSVRRPVNNTEVVICPVRGVGVGVRTENVVRLARPECILRILRDLSRRVVDRPGIRSPSVIDV